MVDKICEVCSAPYRVQDEKYKSKYCSRECKSKANTCTVSCRHCGISFTKPNSSLSKYCSAWCRVHYYNRKKVCEVCGENYTVSRGRAGKTKYCSVKCKDIGHSSNMRGEGNPNWTGGSGKDLRAKEGYKKWRFEVFKRDDFICQKCGKKAGRLNAHHILSYTRYPEHRTVVENGDTLCIACHKEFHSLYGIKSFTDKEYWEWLSET